jgi:secreted Zn-dependent insulinase-like peptidase
VKGVAITIGGFAHKLGVLAGKIGGRMADMAAAFTDLQFDMQKDAAARSYANFNLDAPYQVSRDAYSLLFCSSTVDCWLKCDFMSPFSTRFTRHPFR